VTENATAACWRSPLLFGPRDGGLMSRVLSAGPRTGRASGTRFALEHFFHRLFGVGSRGRAALVDLPEVRRRGRGLLTIVLAEGGPCGAAAWVAEATRVDIFRAQPLRTPREQFDSTASLGEQWATSRAVRRYGIRSVMPRPFLRISWRFLPSSDSSRRTVAMRIRGGTRRVATLVPAAPNRCADGPPTSHAVE
jgi:hypothetical protein